MFILCVYFIHYDSYANRMSKTDPLIYSSLTNNLTDDQLNSTGLATKIVSPDPSQTASYLNSMLNKTVIKRACCINKNRPGSTLTKFPVTVRLPIPPNYDFGSNPLADTWKKFGYIDKTIYVPQEMCSTLDDTYDYNTNQCQDFMALYCNNVKAFYKDEVKSMGLSYNDDEFAKYKPECACYGDQPKYLTGSLPPVCFAPGCDPDNNEVFQDTNSRKSCTVTICQSNFDANGLSVGGNANINSKVSQQCGNQINQPTPVAPIASNIVANQPNPPNQTQITQPISPISSNTVSNNQDAPSSSPSSPISQNISFTKPPVQTMPISGNSTAPVISAPTPASTTPTANTPATSVTNSNNALIGAITIFVCIVLVLILLKLLL